MSLYEFLKDVLTRLEDLQRTLNSLRSQVKEEIKNEQRQ